MTWPTSALVGALLVAAVVLAGCGSGKETPASTPTAAATPSVATPTPTVMPGGPTGHLRTTAQATCEAGPVGADLVVRYAVTADVGVVSRVRLYIDDQEAQDSGALSQPTYVRIATLAVEPGSRHTYKVSAESPTAPAFSLSGRVSCPGTPGPTT